MRIPIVIAETVRAFIARFGFGFVVAFVASSVLVVARSPATLAQEMAFSHAAEEAARRIADAFPVLQGSVVGVEGDRILLDLGAQQKVYQGMELQVYREAGEVKHPVTGQVLGRRDKRLGLLRVVEVKEGFSEATLVSRQEGATIIAGDLVRVSHDRLSVALPLINAGEVKGPNLNSVTKDLAIALAKTGRFIVIEDHLIRAALMEQKLPQFESFTDPAVLKTLAEKTRAQLLVLGKLSPADQGVFLNLQVVSISTGSPLTVAGVEVTGPQPRIAATPSGPSASTTLAKSTPEFVRVPPSKPAEPQKAAIPEITSPQRQPIPREVQRKPGTPSFLVGGEDVSGQSGDQAAKDHLTFDLKEALLAVAAGDLNGDHRPEVVGMTASEIIVYRWKDRRLEPIARTGVGESFIRHLHLDVGDVNGSGQAQVVVTALSSVPEGLKLRNALHSYVLELRGDKLVRIADGMDYFLRVLTGPGIETPMLIGQRMGETTPFTGPIVRLAWSGERYIEEQPLVLPGQVKSLYDFAPLEVAGNQVMEIAVITARGRVITYGRGGQALWEGKDDLGEVDHLAFFQTPELQAIFFPHAIRSGIPANPEEYSDRLVLPRRLLVQSSPLWGDAKAEFLTLANSVKYGVQVSLGGEAPPSGRVVAYDRHDGTFARGWETVPVEGKVRDVAVVDLNGAGRRDLIVLSAVKEKGFVASLKDQARGIINVFSFTR
jgi:TolB-like protein